MRPNFNRIVSTVNWYRWRNGLVKILGKSEARGFFGKEWYLQHHPVVNSKKPGNVCRVCNVAAKYEDVYLDDKLLLQGLIGTMFRFREGLKSLTSHIDSLFLQVQVPEWDKICMCVLWWPTMNELRMIKGISYIFLLQTVDKIAQTMLWSECRSTRRTCL